VDSIKDRLFRLDVNKRYFYGDVFSGQVDLAYDSISLTPFGVG